MREVLEEKQKRLALSRAGHIAPHTAHCFLYLRKLSMFPTTNRNATPLCEISRQTKPAFISEIRDSFRQILFYVIALLCLNVVFRIVVW